MTRRRPPRSHAPWWRLNKALTAERAAETVGTPLKAVLLDFGHTLVNYEADEAALLESYRDIHAFLGMTGISHEPLPDDLMMQVFRRLSEVITKSYAEGQIEELDCLALYDDAFRHLGFQLDRELLHKVLELDHRALSSQFEVPESTLAALREIRHRGYKVGLVSNATPTGEVMRHDLEVLGLADLIDAASFSSEVGFRKPDPRIYLAVTKALELDPQDCLFIGDRVKEDIAGPRSLGMRAVLSHEFRQEDPGSSQPVAIIRRFPELVGVLENLRKESDSDSRNTIG
jgi:putative hydrolase of the HAD superfamily